MVDARGENFVFWFSRTQKNASLDAFQTILFLRRKFFVQQKSGGAMVHPTPPHGCVDPALKQNYIAT